MTLHNLFLKSEMLFWERSSEIREIGEMLAVLATENPKHWLGNFIIIEHAPLASELPALIAQIDKALKRYSKSPHFVLLWQSGQLEPDVIAALASMRLEYDVSDILTLNQLTELVNLNTEVEIIEVGNENNLWTKIEELNDECFGGSENTMRSAFTKLRFQTYRELIREGKGKWYAAYLDGELAGSCGIFHGGGFYRYQQVAVSEKFRRQGVASSLLHHAASKAGDVQVINVDSNSDLQQLYLNLGFSHSSVSEVIKRRKRPIPAMDLKQFAHLG